MSSQPAQSLLTHFAPAQLSSPNFAIDHDESLAFKNREGPASRPKIPTFLDRRLGPNEILRIALQ
jgi:hypothetical protein